MQARFRSSSEASLCARNLGGIGWVGIAERGSVHIHIRQLVRACLCGFVFVVVLAVPGSAQGSTNDNPSRDQIVLSGQLVVPQGETVDTALIFHGPATIAGTA